MAAREKVADKNVATTELAAVLGISARRVQQLAQDGILDTVERGKFELGAAVQAYIRFLGRDAMTEEDKKLESAKRKAEATLKLSKAKIAKAQADELSGQMHRSEDVCPGCGCISDEYTMKRAPAKWVADNPAAYDNGIRSFWLNAFVSQWATWKSIVLKFLEAIGDTAKMQVVYNTCFGKLWENRGDIQDEDTLLGRREEYEAELPDGVLVLTAGIDTQDDRMEYEIKGHGHFGETWGIEKGIVMGRPDDDATWKQLDELVFNRYFQFKDGIKLRVSMSFVDEGGHFTQEVRQRCRERIGRKVFCIKGFAGPDRPYTGPPKQVKIVVNGTHVGTCWQYQIGVDAGKQIIMDNLRVGTVGPKYCHFPKRDDYGIGYFNGLLSEHLVYKKDKRQPWQWEKIPGHERNEALDCCNYAMAAFKALPCDLDGIDRALKRARGVTVDTPAALEVPQTKSPQPKRRGLSKYYDEW